MHKKIKKQCFYAKNLPKLIHVNYNDSDFVKLLIGYQHW